MYGALALSVRNYPFLEVSPSTPWRGWTFSPRVQRQKRGPAGSQRPAGGYSRTDHAAIVAPGPNTAVAFSTDRPKGAPVSKER